MFFQDPSLKYKLKPVLYYFSPFLVKVLLETQAKVCGFSQCSQVLDVSEQSDVFQPMYSACSLRLSEDVVSQANYAAVIVWAAIEIGILHSSCFC